MKTETRIACQNHVGNLQRLNNDAWGLPVDISPLTDPIDGLCSIGDPYEAHHKPIYAITWYIRPVEP